jgi:hypothetical protein
MTDETRADMQQAAGDERKMTVTHHQKSPTHSHHPTTSIAAVVAAAVAALKRDAFRCSDDGQCWLVPVLPHPLLLLSVLTVAAAVVVRVVEAVEDHWRTTSLYSAVP